MSAPAHDSRPAWEAAFFSLLHPVQIAAVEAFLWIEQPLSSVLLYEVLERTWPFTNVAYHVRWLALNGVLEERFSEPPRGANEHFYELVR